MTAPHRGRRPTAGNTDKPSHLSFARRILEEVEVVAAQMGVPEKELCRRAGYNPQYLAQRKRELRRAEEGRLNKLAGQRPGSGGLTHISMRFLADVEEAWGVKFEITGIPSQLRNRRVVETLKKARRVEETEEPVGGPFGA